MNFDQLWSLILKQNPQLKTGTVKMSAHNFKRAMEFAYKKGESSAPMKGSDLFTNLFR